MKRMLLLFLLISQKVFATSVDCAYSPPKHIQLDAENLASYNFQESIDPSAQSNCSVVGVYLPNDYLESQLQSAAMLLRPSSLDEHPSVLMLNIEKVPGEPSSVTTILCSNSVLVYELVVSYGALCPSHEFRMQWESNDL